MMKNGITKKKVFVASVVGSIVTLQFGSFSVALETLLSGVSELTFSSFVAVMQPIHVAIGLVEGLITASVLCFIYEARPELLWGSNRTEEKRKQYSMKKILVVLGIVSVLVGGALSLVASSSPDGLEWSIGKVTGKEELTSECKVHNEVKKIQDKTSYMKDYSFKEGETPVGTSFSGIFGGFLVLSVLLIIGSIVKYRRRKDFNEEFE